MARSRIINSWNQGIKNHKTWKSRGFVRRIGILPNTSTTNLISTDASHFIDTSVNGHAKTAWIGHFSLTERNGNAQIGDWPKIGACDSGEVKVVPNADSVNSSSREAFSAIIYVGYIRDRLVANYNKAIAITASPTLIDSSHRSHYFKCALFYHNTEPAR